MYMDRMGELRNVSLSQYDGAGGRWTAGNATRIMTNQPNRNRLLRYG
jgi:hypothetical protein